MKSACIIWKQIDLLANFTLVGSLVSEPYLNARLMGLG
jgi:hypothetical protein